MREMDECIEDESGKEMNWTETMIAEQGTEMIECEVVLETEDATEVDEDREEGKGKMRWIFDSFRRRGNLEIHRTLHELDHLHRVLVWSRLASGMSKTDCFDFARQLDENREKRGEPILSPELDDRVREGESE